MNERPNLNPPDPPETMDEAYEKYRFTDYTCDGYGGETEKFAITDYADCLYRAQCLAQYSHDDVRIQGLRKGKWETIETVKADYFEGEIFKLKKRPSLPKRFVEAICDLMESPLHDDDYEVGWKNRFTITRTKSGWELEGKE